MGPYVAYMIPIACRLLFNEPFFPGPFYLGRWSRPMAWVSVSPSACETPFSPVACRLSVLTCRP
jgi:hypothetical protein